MARRASLSQAGKPAVANGDRTRSSLRTSGGPGGQPKPTGCTCGGQCDQAKPPAEPARQARAALTDTTRERRAPAKRSNGGGHKPSGRMVALARRTALSGRGKAAANASNPSAATLARQANPRLSSRELAQEVRTVRSRNGGSGNKRAPTGRVRPSRGEREGGAEDATWKVGASATASGELITGTQVGRSVQTTGNEPGLCRNVTGTEYMGAEIFQTFCHAEAPVGPAKVSRTSTAAGRQITGSRVGRSTRVTGDEPGTCKGITGTEYLAVEDADAFCDALPAPRPTHVGPAATRGGQPVSGVLVGRSGRVTGDEPGSGLRLTGSQYMESAPGEAPPKVGESATYRGGSVTGTRVGRGSRVTGDEPGSCRLVTGNQYVGREQYTAFCDAEPQPEVPKVAQMTTLRQQRVSGVQTGRSSRVTGDEPGTCKTVTGTPYAGLDQYRDYCTPDQTADAVRRVPPMGLPSLTGIQPGLGGPLTGAERGACEPVTGTQYVGADQLATVCEATAATPDASDYPRPIVADANAPSWQRFSVQSPARAAHQARQVAAAVTGTRYEQGQITGPFGLGTGKVTGTEQFRFDHKAPGRDPGRGTVIDQVAEATSVDARPRVTGEGQSAGTKITGDDWERGDRVTGTEGASATRRNPTRPGPMSAMLPADNKRNQQLEPPTSRVTGSSGSTDKGALVTVSGGARG